MNRKIALIIIFFICLSAMNEFVYSQNRVVNSNRNNFGFNYDEEDNRPFMRCGQYSDIEIDSLEKAFEVALDAASTKREKTVVAANFLATLPYAIPYAYESDKEGYELAWKYTRKGLFLRNVVENGRLYNAWGCDILSKGLPKERVETLKNLGDTFKVGFHCSSFIRWCLYNGDAATQNILEGSWANDFGHFPGSDKLALKDNLDKIIPGDLLYFPVDEKNGHIAIVIGVKNGVVTFVEDALWGNDHLDSRNGVRWRTFDINSTDFNKYRFKWLIKMDNVYKD